MKADGERTYELLWHMNEDWAQLQGRRTVTKNLTIFTAEQTPQWSLIIGQEEPEWQGYVATASIQGCYAPVPTLSQQVTGRKSAHGYGAVSGIGLGMSGGIGGGIAGSGRYRDQTEDERRQYGGTGREGIEKRNGTTIMHEDPGGERPLKI